MAKKVFIYSWVD